MKSFLFCIHDQNLGTQYLTSQPFNCPEIPYFTLNRDCAKRFNVNDFNEELLSFVSAHQFFLIEI